MERRDYLITQIQQLGQFIKLLIEKLTGKPSTPGLEKMMTLMNEDFKEQCGFDIELLSSPHPDELKDKILSSRNYSSSNIELLADFMVVLANKDISAPVTMVQRLKNNAVQLYQLLETSEKTYSVERNLKIEELKNSI